MLGQVNVSIGWERDTIELGNEVNLLLFLKVLHETEINTVSGGFLDSLISGFQTIKMREADTTRSKEFEYADAEVVNYGQFSIDEDDGVFTDSELSWQRSEVGGEVLLSNKFRMRIWDPGQIIASNPIVEYTIQGQNFISNQKYQAPLYVRPPIDIAVMEKDSFDISPIKTIIKEPINWSDYRPYALAFFGIVLALASFFFYKNYQKRRKALPVEKVEIIIPAHEIALDKLRGLDQKKLWQSDIKTYQSELTHIVREYLENRYHIPALETTTDEIVNAIQKKELTSDVIGEMKNILQVADLVKFAKSKPSLNIHQEFMEKALEFVQETKKIIIEPEVTDDQ